MLYEVITIQIPKGYALLRLVTEPNPCRKRKPAKTAPAPMKKRRIATLGVKNLCRRPDLRHGTRTDA